MFSILLGVQFSRVVFSVFLFILLSVSVSSYPSVWLSFTLSISVFISLPICRVSYYLCFSVFLFFRLSVSVFHSVYICFYFFYPSVMCRIVCLFLSVSVPLSVCLSFFHFVYFSFCVFSPSNYVTYFPSSPGFDPPFLLVA